MKTLKKTRNTSTSEHGKLAEEKTQKKNHSWKVQNSERDRTNSCASSANNYNSLKQIWSHWRKDKQRIVYLWNQILQKKRRHRVCLSWYELVGKTCRTWLINARHQSITISATVLKTMPLYFARVPRISSVRWEIICMFLTNKKKTTWSPPRLKQAYLITIN